MLVVGCDNAGWPPPLPQPVLADGQRHDHRHTDRRILKGRNRQALHLPDRAMEEHIHNPRDIEPRQQSLNARTDTLECRDRRE